uniref:DUF4371 domain-containing protein n=1 Tax=Amphimedon queenslandica TaxID=400682 RepID=A0A1X7UEJ2_AMPQE
MEIALRGHREAVDSLNRGNFIEILLLLSRYDHVIQDRLQKGPRNALYTSHDIQNTIIHIMGQIVRQKISNDIQRAGYYSLLVDETKDISKKEQMSFVIRYVDPVSSNIAERFLTFIIAPNLTAEHLTQYILDTLSLYNINLSSMVSQGYLDERTITLKGCSKIKEIDANAIDEINSQSQNLFDMINEKEDTEVLQDAKSLAHSVSIILLLY